MDIKLEKAAMKGYELPKGLTLAEQGYYLALRTLYTAYQKGVVTKKQAAEEKKAILAAYTTEHSKEEFLDRSALAMSEPIISATTGRWRRQIPSMRRCSICLKIGEKKWRQSKRKDTVIPHKMSNTPKKEEN